MNYKKGIFFSRRLTEQNSIHYTTVKSCRRGKKVRKRLCHNILDDIWFVRLGVSFTRGRLRYTMKRILFVDLDIKRL